MENPDPLKDLDIRLRNARTKQNEEKTGRLAKSSNMTGFGMAFRVGAELVSALIVGVGTGYMLDNWLGTAPWFMVVFFFIGAAAGVLNVYRAAGGLFGGGDDDQT